MLGLFLIALIMAINFAQFAYVESTYLNQFFTLEFVGIIFFVAYLLTFFAINRYSNYIVKFTNFKTVIFSVCLEIISMAIFIFSQSPAVIFIGFILYVISTNLIWINFDIFLEAYTANETTGKIRGGYYTVYNLGWLLSPFLTGKILETMGFQWLFYFITFLSIALILILSVVFYKFKVEYVHKHFHLKDTIIEVLKDKNIARVFFIALLLQIFYAIMIVYMPLYLNQHIGLDWIQIGIIFTIMLVPFVLLEFPAGYLADKYWGEKEMMTAGLIFMSVASIAVFFIDKPSLLVWALLLFLSRVGASLVEIMRDTYFFKKVNVGNIDLINTYRSTTPLAYMLAPIGASFILYFLPFNYIFLMLGLLLTSGLTATLMIRDTK